MDIVLGNYKGLKANIPYIAYTEEDVNSQIATLLSGNPVREQKTGPLAMGDTAVIDYEGFKDGVAFEGGKAEKYPLGIGSGSFIPGFEEQLVGMEIGEDRDINLSFPEQYHAPELAGKAVVFKVKLHEIYNEKEAELNDEFAASLNFPEVQSVEDLKKYINEYLEYQVEARKADAAREKLYDQILESSSCLVSPQAVETAVNMQLQQMAASFAQQGVAMEQYLQMTGKTMDSLKDELKPVAQKQVKLEAVLDEIIRVENITVSDEEMDEQYELISQKYGQPVDVVKQVLPKAQLKPDLLRMKASQLIIDAAEIIMEESGIIMYRIFLVEDDETIAKLVRRHLEKWDYDVHVVQKFDAVMSEFASFDPHLVLMDIGLPFYNGYHWCTEIRRVSKVPVVFLSSAADNMNIVMAVSMGADDFIAKPFDLDVLTVKIQAIIRRCYDFGANNSVLEHNGAMLNISDATITYDDKRLELTKNELKILQTLFDNKERIVSRSLLMEKLWESDAYVDENTLSVNVNRLRKKLDSIGLESFIVTKKGLGYRLG